jgi:hypothetical protein
MGDVKPWLLELFKPLLVFILNDIPSVTGLKGKRLMTRFLVCITLGTEHRVLCMLDKNSTT